MIDLKLLFIIVRLKIPARRTEMMKLQVELANQRFIVPVKKGKMYLVWKKIKDVALPYWIEAMDSRFYDLKHLNTTDLIDEIEDELEKEAVKEAANHNSNTTEAMIVSIVKQTKRKHTKLKKAANAFA